MTEMLEGITVLDLASVGPAARGVALAGRLRRDGREGRPGAEGHRRADHAALLRVQRAPTDAARARRHEGARRSRGVPAAGRAGRRAHRELPARRGRPARHRLGGDVGPQPAPRVLLDQRVRPDRTALAVGGPRPQLPRRRRLPALHRPRRRRPAAGTRPHARRQRGRWHARGDGDPRRARAARHHRRGRVPRRVDRRRRARAHGARGRRVPRDGRGARAASRPAHRPLRVLRHLSDARRTLAHGRRDRTALLGEPLRARRPAAVGGAPGGRRGAGPDPRRAARGVPHPRPRRLGRRAESRPTRASHPC